MVERLRELAARPLDRRVGRAVLILALAITVGVCLLVALAAVGRDDGSSPAAHRAAAARPASAGSVAPAISATATPAPRRPRQDPQDRRGSAARRRAVAELRSHRALQHVPYDHRGLTIRLVGARGPKAVLRVTAATVPAARSGWRRFLHRFDDAGHAYRPVFSARRGRDG